MSYLIPLAWLAYVLAFPGFRTATTAQKNTLAWWYPTQSKRGNYPPAQRTHEGGGWRFGALLSLPVMIALAAAFAHSPEAFDDTEIALDALTFELEGPALSIIAQGFVSILALFAVFMITRKWIDIAEHGAEILHAERDGMADYREAEIARMAKNSDYHGLSHGEIGKRLIRAEWRSRIILMLGGW